MKKLMKKGTILLFSLVMLLPITAQASAWPSENETEVISSNPFSSEVVFDSTTSEQSSSSSQEYSVFDSQNQTIEEQRVPIFDSSIRDIGEIDYTDTSDLLPDVSMDDAVEWAQRKSYEVIQLLQTFVQPICVIAFIICAFMLLFGTIAHNQLAGRGLMGLIISSVVYGLVMFAPVIVQTFTAWLSA